MMPSMADEEIQELGREGVGMVKAWLESTTWMQLPMNAYQDRNRVKVEYAPGKMKKFDLSGHFLGDSRHDIWVECKRYSSEGIQHGEFRKFLAIAYGHSWMERKRFSSPSDAEYMWVTSHPFFISGWKDLVSEGKLQAAYEGMDDDFKGAVPWDADLGRDVASRIWLLVWSEKQIERLALTSSELRQVMTVIAREGAPLWSK